MAEGVAPRVAAGLRPSAGGGGSPRPACHDGAQLRRLHRPSLWAVHFQRQVSSRPMVVAETARQNSSKETFVHDDHVVEAFPADRANQAIHEWRLPVAPGRDENLFDSQGMHQTAELAASDAVPVTQEASGCCIPRTASTTCSAVHWAVGDAVTLKCTRRRRS